MDPRAALVAVCERHPQPDSLGSCWSMLLHGDVCDTVQQAFRAAWAVITDPGDLAGQVLAVLIVLLCKITWSLARRWAPARSRRRSAEETDGAPEPGAGPEAGTLQTGQPRPQARGATRLSRRWHSA